MSTDISKLPLWQQGCFNDRVRIWKVDHPNDSQGNAGDDVITLNEEGVACYLEFAVNVAEPTDAGRVRRFSLRRATVINLPADVELGADWFIEDVTPERPADARFVYKVMESPSTFPTQGLREMNLRSAVIERDPHPPAEIVGS